MFPLPKKFKENILFISIFSQSEISIKTLIQFIVGVTWSKITVYVTLEGSCITERFASVVATYFSVSLC